MKRKNSSVVILAASFVIITCVFFFWSFKSSTIYIVRHADKADKPADDPSLTQAGTQRANTLADLLADKKIRAIYSTNTLRTRSTAQPLSDRITVRITLYSNVDELMNQISSSFSNTLVVGHSNTILEIYSKLGCSSSQAAIGDDDFDTLLKVYRIYIFFWTWRWCVETTYGVNSP